MWQSRTASWHRHDDALEHNARNPMGRNALLNKIDQPESVDRNATATAAILPDNAGFCKGPISADRETNYREIGPACQATPPQPPGGRSPPRYLHGRPCSLTF